MVVADLDGPLAERAAAELGASAYPLDVTDHAAFTAVLDAVERDVGALDILVNNAAITFDGDLALPMKRWDLVMEVNVRAPLLAMRAALPIMKRAGQGRILNISSAAAVLPIRGLLVYGVSKAALERLTTGAAEETVADGVAVNCLRIDVPIASEGFVHNTPGLDHSAWEPTEVGAEAALWVLARPLDYTGQVVGIMDLRRLHGVAESRVGG